ncbi:retrovirus-related pol polyprotein from transposon TNT 1-94 [Tanacetum coccineum]
MCMFALTVSIVEPKNIKEAMADSAWIEAMQDELHQRRFMLLQFIDPNHLEKVYLLRKALYGLKQAPRAWYDELSNFLMSKGFTKGTIDPTLFKIKYGEDILLVQIYVDDIIFGSTNPKYSKRFEKLMHSRFEMSLMGDEVLFRTTDPPVPKRCTIEHVLLVSQGSALETTAFFQTIYHARCMSTQKSTSGGYSSLGDKLVSWMSKKQNYTAMSSAEAEYVALSASCAQVMWMRTQLQDYGFNYNKMTVVL